MKQDKPVLFMVTHCESCYNRDRLFTGRIDAELSESGIAHAHEMAESLKDRKIDIAYRTSLIRTKQTLDPILKYHPKCEVRVDDRLIERDYGDLSGKNKDEYAKSHPKMYPIYHRSYETPPPNGESIQQVEKRVLDFLNKLKEEMRRTNMNVLLVIHANSARPLIRHFKHLSIEEMMGLEHTRHVIYKYWIE